MSTDKGFSARELGEMCDLLRVAFSRTSSALAEIHARKSAEVTPEEVALTEATAASALALLESQREWSKRHPVY
jgi:hypothetical protein